MSDEEDDIRRWENVMSSAARVGQTLQAGFDLASRPDDCVIYKIHPDGRYERVDPKDFYEQLPPTPRLGDMRRKDTPK